MSEKTPIEWCDSTVNPVMGCDGCELWTGPTKACYAGILHDRYGGHSKGYAPSFEQVTLFPGRMETTCKWKDLTGQKRPGIKPWLDDQPRAIFVSDMADALSKSVSFEYLYAEIVEVARKSPHNYLWLTKRPNRMAQFDRWMEREGRGSWPSNLWAGTSVTDQRTADTRIPEILKVSAKTHFLSVEPLLESTFIKDAAFKKFQLWENVPNINWLVVGGESGPKSRPCHVEWIRSIVKQCASAEVPCFVKQLGASPRQDTNGEIVPLSGPLTGKANVKILNSPLYLKDKKGGDPAEWPADLRVRQFPTVNL